MGSDGLRVLECCGWFVCVGWALSPVDLQLEEGQSEIIVQLYLVRHVEHEFHDYGSSGYREIKMDGGSC